MNRRSSGPRRRSATGNVPAIALLKAIEFDDVTPTDLVATGTHQIIARPVYFTHPYGNVAPGPFAPTYTTSDASKLTVSSAGLVTAVAAPGANIHVDASGIRATKAITVVGSAPTLTTIDVSPSSLSLVVGGTGTITATPRDNVGGVMAGITPTWSESDGTKTDIAPTSGLQTVVTAVAEGGTPQVRASSGAVNSAWVNITITAAPAGTIYLTENFESRALATIADGTSLQSGLTVNNTAKFTIGVVDAATAGITLLAGKTRCLRIHGLDITIPAGGAAHPVGYIGLKYINIAGLALANPMYSLSTGLYTRWYMYVPTATMQELSTGGSEQLKFFLDRWNPTSGGGFGNNNQSGAAGWDMWGWGNTFSGSTLSLTRDYNIQPFKGGTNHLTTGLGWTKNPGYLGGSWLECQVWRKTDGTVSHSKHWLNGTQVHQHDNVPVVAGDYTNPDGSVTSNAAYGGGNTSHFYALRLGATYVSIEQQGTLTMFLDKIALANRYILSSE